MATNDNYNPQSKTTKKVRGIHSWVKARNHQGVESLTIMGKETLANLSQDINGDTNLILNADEDKLNALISSVPFLNVLYTTTGTDPNKEKTATVSQDLTHFPLFDGELVTVAKETNSLTIHDEKVKEFVNTVVSNAVAELKIFINTTVSNKETELKEYIQTHYKYLDDKIENLNEKIERINK